MIHPSARLTALAAGATAAAAVAALVRPDDGLPAVLTLDGVLLFVALVDLWRLPRRRRLDAARECGSVCSLGRRQRVTLTFDNRTSRPQRVHAVDDRPAPFTAEPRDLLLTIPARSRAVVHYFLTPRRRGSYTLDAIHLRVASPAGLWWKTVRKPADTVLRVYPDLRQITRYELLARTNRLSLMGVRRTRRAGGDNDFERLRDYTTDDNHRTVDWRATARRRRLIVRDFQATRSQRLVFLIDGGRMMMNEAGGLSLLDHALDAMLMLAHVALARGDQVGLLYFSDRVHRWIDVEGGRRHLNRIVHAVHDRFPEPVESRYDEAFLHLHRHCRKRTLVVLVTNLIDDVNARQVRGHLTR
ncbi:MAG: DUF58 domain-containing protein, partial [Planctomycetia bacterium]